MTIIRGRIPVRAAFGAFTARWGECGITLRNCNAFGRIIIDVELKYLLFLGIFFFLLIRHFYLILPAMERGRAWEPVLFLSNTQFWVIIKFIIQLYKLIVTWNLSTVNDIIVVSADSFPEWLIGWLEYNWCSKNFWSRRSFGIMQ